MSLLADSADPLIELVRRLALPIPPLVLVDVGVSGGLNTVWRRWGDELAALGIDALEKEVYRLQLVETNPAVRYEAALVVGPDRPEPARTSNYALHRSSAYLATAILEAPRREGTETAFRDLWQATVDGRTAPIPTDAGYTNVTDPAADPFQAYYRRRFGGADSPKLTDRIATLDELVTLPRVDVLKVDTDGADFDVLRGGARTLATCLAVEIEVQFHGPVSDTSNVFCNIDSFMRRNGFTLFRLAPVAYSRSALPQPFTYNLPAQTRRGPIAWGDALYVRDGAALPPERQRTLALILDLYGLEDAAAEILLRSPGLFDGADDRPLLDHLAAKIHGPGIDFRRVAEAFMSDPLVPPGRRSRRRPDGHAGSDRCAAGVDARARVRRNGACLSRYGASDG